MKVNVIGSGSKGNSTLIEFEKSKILIDVGFSYKYIKEKLEELEVKPNEIDYIFITHGHSDHIKGLQVFLNRNNPSEELYLCNHRVPNTNLFLYIKFSIDPDGSIDVISFHESSEPI